jgi:hypothetical protein
MAYAVALQRSATITKPNAGYPLSVGTRRTVWIELHWYKYRGDIMALTLLL